VLPAEDPAAFNRHAQDLFEEYKPKNPTEKQFVRELADTSWRMNRIPFLERDILMLSVDLPASKPAATLKTPFADKSACSRISACTATASPASSTRRSISFARSRPTW
jgi:hypothetical protein